MAEEQLKEKFGRMVKEIEDKKERHDSSTEQLTAELERSIEVNNSLFEDLHKMRMKHDYLLDLYNDLVDKLVKK